MSCRDRAAITLRSVLPSSPGPHRTPDDEQPGVQPVAHAVLMRIGICAPYDLARDGGVNSHIRAQAQALRRLGHAVQIFGAASASLRDGEQAVSGCMSAVIGETE